MRDALDRLSEALAPARDLYVAELLEALAGELDRGGDVDAEPVARDVEGRIIRDGALALPSRRDLRIDRDGRRYVRRVEGGGGWRFAQLDAPVGDVAAAHIGPLSWGAIEVRMLRAPGAPNWAPLRLWFLEAFQARFGDESPDLLGVAHRLDGPRDAPGGWDFTVDLGSAPVSSFVEMLDALAQSGCAEIRVGEPARAR